MTESQFITENEKQWEALEQLLKWKIKDPKKLSDIFAKVSNDLAYAQTYFPRRSVTLYLNDLVGRLFDAMKARRKYNFLRSILNYFGHILPTEIIRNRKAFLLSMLVFFLATAVGVYSTIQEADFPRHILGNEYVAMTNSNIEAGDPMAVYKSGTRWDSFIGITMNNILVSFYAFAFGILGTLGTFFVLIKNGIMLGAFQTMFYQKDLLAESMLTIWIHGTIEISSIIIAGAAGIILGNSILFPKSLSRMESLKLGATRAMYILISTLPLFIIAGSFEGFVTPMTEVDNAFKLGIIIVSAVFILLIYVIYPYFYYRSGQYNPASNLHTNKAQVYANNVELSTDKYSIKYAFQEIGADIGTLFSKVIIPVGIFLIGFTYLFLLWKSQELFTLDAKYNQFSWSMGKELMLIAVLISSLYFFVCMYCLEKQVKINSRNVVSILTKHFLPLIIIALFNIVPLYFIPGHYGYLLIFIIPPAISVYVIKHLVATDDGLEALGSGIKIGYKSWGNFVVTSLLIVLALFLSRYSFNSIFNFIIQDVLSWHQFFEEGMKNQIFINSIGLIVYWVFFLPFTYLIYRSKADHMENALTSKDLEEKIIIFGNKKIRNA